jgi:phage terminase small subunit
MGRPKKPLKLHVLQDTAQPCRMEKRKGELELPAEIPLAPEWLSVEAAIEWGRLTSHPLYSKVLSAVDRGMLAIYCTLWGHFVTGEKTGTPVKAAHVAQMNALAGKLGLSPADRTKIRLDPEEKPRNRFSNLAGRK